MGEMRNSYEILIGNHNGRDYLGYVGLDGRKKERIVSKEGVWTGLN
jgi:hypothetical protein